MSAQAKMIPRVDAEILAELEIRAECLEEENPEDAISIRRGIEDIKFGIVPTGGSFKAIAEELQVMEDFDAFWLDKTGRRHWLEASAWLGTLEAWRDDVISTGKRKSVIIGGIKYQV